MLNRFMNSKIVCKPKIGMKFIGTNDAWKSRSASDAKIGLGVQKQWYNTSKNR